MLRIPPAAENLTAGFTMTKKTFSLGLGIQALNCFTI